MHQLPPLSRSLRPAITTLSIAAVILAGLAVATPGAADENDSAGAAMQELDFLVGDWEGSGWMRQGPSEPHHFTSSESVESRLGGRLLLIEGLHHAEDPAAGEEPTVVHHAMAMITYDREADNYRFQSHLASGRSGEYRGTLEEGRFVWGMEVPGGKVRYSISVEDSVWHETGEFSSDGEHWNQFFEMTLKRVEDQL